MYLNLKSRQLFMCACTSKLRNALKAIWWWSGKLQSAQVKAESSIKQMKYK